MQSAGTPSASSLNRQVYQLVCTTSRETSETVCITSYRAPQGNNDLLINVKIWEACRARSVATSLFDPSPWAVMGKSTCVDGATGANNPVRKMWDKAQLM